MEVQTETAVAPVPLQSLTSAVTQGTAEVATATGALTDDQIGEQLKPLDMELAAAERKLTAAEELHASAAATAKDAAKVAKQERDRVGLEYGKWCWALDLNNRGQGRKDSGFKNACARYQQDFQKARYWRDKYALANDLKPKPRPKGSDASTQRYVSLQVLVPDRETELALLTEWDELSSEEQSEVIHLGLEALRGKKPQGTVPNAAAA